jgi:hypothetical protein
VDGIKWVSQVVIVLWGGERHRKDTVLTRSFLFSTI